MKTAIILIFACVIVFLLCYSCGYKVGTGQGKTKAEIFYSNEVSRLNAKRHGQLKYFENEIAMMNKDYTQIITGMKTDHDSTIAQMNNKHKNIIADLRDRQKRELENTRRKYHGLGQQNMSKRIGEVYDFDITNKSATSGWNDAIEKR